VPNIVAQLRASGRAHVEEHLVADPDGYEAVRGNAPEENPLEWAMNHAPQLIANFGIRLLPKLITMPDTIDKIARLHW